MSFVLSQFIKLKSDFTLHFSVSRLLLDGTQVFFMILDITFDESIFNVTLEVAIKKSVKQNL